MLLLAIGLAVVLIVVIIVAVASSNHSTPTRVTSGSGGTTTTSVPLGPVTASTALTAGRGTVVFSDNFQDPSSGWATLPTAYDTLSYGTGGFVISASGNYLFHDYAPYSVPVPQIGISTTATQTAGSPSGDGFGVLCDRGLGTTDIHYEFVLRNSSNWVIFRHNGPVTNQTLVLKEGTAPAAAGTTPATVTAMCATQSDGSTTRLVMFVNGTMVADLTDTATLPGSGWNAGVVVRTLSGPGSTVTFSKFSEADLDH